MIINLRENDMPEEFQNVPVRLAIFNGPPGSGKDAACRFLGQAKSVRHEKLSSPLKLLAGLALGLSEQEILEDKNKVVRGKSIRQHQIDVFHALSDLFGPTVLVDMWHTYLKGILYEHIIEHQGVIPIYVLSDGGRQEELDALVDKFGADNLFLVRLHREGFTFDGDIRTYIYHDDVKSVDVNNDGTLGDLESTVLRLLNEFNTAWVQRNAAKIEALGGKVYQTR